MDTISTGPCLHSLSDAHFDSPGADELVRDDLWWEIYRHSFPENEQEPASVVVESLLNGVGLAFRARSGQTTIGIATTHLLKNPAAVFLVYLAIHRDHRDAGVGGALLEYAWTVSKAHMKERGLDPLGMVWEVDAPQTVSDPGEEVLRQRRIAFFHRHGGVLLARPYIQPPVDGVMPVPMRLMFRPGARIPDGAGADALVRAIYFEKYGDLNRVPGEILTDLFSQHTIR